jgi:16S rRNA (cytidine1402-2'-O)-methyltransferase
VSDAGTPLISDPGGQLVAAAVEAGHELEAVPGASAVLSALTVSGLATQPFTFLGFLPRKAGARRKLLEPFRVRRETLVIFESPRRVACTLAELAELLGNERPAAVARELTKLHQEVARGGLSELAERFAQGARGEFTLVVGGETDAARASRGVEEKIDIAEQIQGLVAEGRRPREIATQLAANSTLPRREIYALALAAKEGRSLLGDASVTDEEAKD